MTERTLVSYFSRGGATSAYACVIAETLQRRGFAVDLVDLHVERSPDLAPYRNIIVGTGVRVGVVYRLGKRMLRRKELRDKRVAVFLASGIAVQDRERARKRFLRPLVRRFGLHPVMLDAFPGKLPNERGALVDHSVPRLAEEWAERLADKLQAEERPTAADSAPSGADHDDESGGQERHQPFGDVPRRVG